MNIDANGDRIADYSLLDMDPDTAEFEVRNRNIHNQKKCMNFRKLIGTLQLQSRKGCNGFIFIITFMAITVLTFYTDYLARFTGRYKYNRTEKYLTLTAAKHKLHSSCVQLKLIH